MSLKNFSEGCLSEKFLWRMSLIVVHGGRIFRLSLHYNFILPRVRLFFQNGVFGYQIQKSSKFKHVLLKCKCEWINGITKSDVNSWSESWWRKLLQNMLAFFTFETSWSFAARWGPFNRGTENWSSFACKTIHWQSSTGPCWIHRADIKSMHNSLRIFYVPVI